MAHVAEELLSKIAWQQYEQVEDVAETRLFLPSQLELLSFLEEGENSISDEKLIKRAKEMQANFGQRQAKYLLEHQNEMAEWPRCHLIFTGTIWIWRLDNRVRLILCLHRNDKLWIPDLYPLRMSFNANGRFLRPRAV